MPGSVGMSELWPERGYDRVEGVEGSPHPHHRAPVPLSSLLSHMSLAYSPITKGLHVLQPGSADEAADADGDDGEEVDDNDESLSEKEPSPKIKIDLAQNSGRDLVLQSCLRQQESAGTLDSEQWISRIGYEENALAGGPLEEPRGDCLLRTEASSFSSIVSSLSDASPSHAEDAASDDRSQRSFDCSEQSKFFIGNSPKLAKKKGLSGFFSKSVFTWKGGSSSSGTNSSPATWKFLGKAVTSSPPTTDSLASLPSDSSLRGSSQSINDGNGQRYGDVVASSTALILHDRPANLPAKSDDERDKHRLEYQNIVDAAKKKEEKDSRLRKKSLQRQLKHEEQLAHAVRVWNSEILPKWEETKAQRRTQDMWWGGLPPCVRGKVWRLALPNDLNVTQQLYHICASRAQERLKSPSCEGRGADCSDGDKESSMDLIQLDIARTFPHLCIFQKGGPYYDILHCVLGAYVCYRPDVGYVQGMSFLAAILILNMDPADAFICFANILNRPCLHAFFTLSQPMVEAYYETYTELLKENLPRLHRHLSHAGLTPDLYLLDWVYSVFGKALNLDVVCRVWDVFMRDGEEFIFRTALGILHLYEKELVELDFVHGAQLLTRLPDSLSADLLFRSIASIKLTVGKLTFAQVLANHLPR